MVDYCPDKKEDALKLITTISGDMIKNQESYYNRLCQREKIMTFECGNGFCRSKSAETRIAEEFFFCGCFQETHHLDVTICPSVVLNEYLPHRIQAFLPDQ